MLRLPLFQLPQLITQLVNARVAIVRLQEFLAAPQEPPAPMLPPAQQGARPGLLGPRTTHAALSFCASPPALLRRPPSSINVMRPGPWPGRRGVWSRHCARKAGHQTCDEQMLPVRV